MGFVLGFGLGVGLGCGCFERRGLDLEAGGLVAPRRLRRGGRLGERADRAEAEDRLEARGDRGELGAQLGLLRAGGEAAGERGDQDAREAGERLPRAQVRVLLAALGPRLGGEGGGGGELLLARARVRAQG